MGLTQSLRRWLGSSTIRARAAVSVISLVLGALTGWASGMFGTPAGAIVPTALFAWAWATGLRVMWCAPGRVFGWYDMRRFGHWLLVPWRMVYLTDTGQRAVGLMRIADWWRLVRLGNGANRRWAGLLETMCYVYRPGDSLLVGRLSWLRLPFVQPVGIPGGGKHWVIVGAPGSGKGLHLQCVLANVHPDQNCFVIDNGGSFVIAQGAVLERQGHNVVKLDPDNIAKGFTKAGRWNPLHELTVAARRHGQAAVVPFAERLAYALIIQDSINQPVFANAARVFMKALILYVWLCEDDKTLIRLRALLTQGMPDKVTDKGDAFAALVEEMARLPAYQKAGERNGEPFDDGCGGEICAAIANGTGAMEMRKGVKENPFKTTAVYQTAWMDDPNIRAIMGASDFDGEDLKFKNTCVFMVATLDDLQTRMAPYVRAFFMLTTYAFQRTPEKRLKIPTLFVIDEAPSIGHIDSLATAAPGYRQFGVRLVIVTQSIQLLRKTYPDEYMDFLTMAQTIIWLGLDDPGDTLKTLCVDMLGSCRKREIVKGTPWYAFWVPARARVSSRIDIGDRLLLDPRQAAEWLDPAAGQSIVTRFGRRPMRLKQLRPFADLAVWQYGVDPRFGERRPRAAMRQFLADRDAGAGLAEALARLVRRLFERRAGDAVSAASVRTTV